MYFEAVELDHLPSNGNGFQTRIVYRNLIIKHLNQSFAISFTFGRLVSYLKAFLDRYVELKNWSSIEAFV